MSTVGTVIIDIKADTAKLVSGMDNAEKKIKKTVSSIQTAIISMATAYVGIQGVKAFTSMINDSVDAADATGKLAIKLGLTTEKLSEYQYAAGFAAVSNGELSAGIGALTRRLNNFQTSGGGAGKKGFEALGISAAYAKKEYTSMDIAFEDILKRLEEMPSSYKKTAIAQDIFSKSASGILRLTGTDLQKFSKEAQKLGISISTGVANMAAVYHDQMDSLNAQITGVERNISFSLLPTMNAVSQTALEMFDNMFGDTNEQMKTFENVAVTSVANVVYSIGFIKDAFDGIDLVLETSKLGFLYLVKGITDAFNIANNLGNSIIEKYNSLPEMLRGEKVELISLRDAESVSDSIDSTKLKIEELVETIAKAGGRGTADEFVKNFKSNLVQIKDEAKKLAEVVIPDIVVTADDNGKATDDLENLNAQNKAAEIIKALEFVKPETDKINESFLSMYDLMEGIFDETQMETFFKKWNKELAGVNDEQSKYEGIGSKDWTAGLEGQAKGLANIGNAFSDIGEEQKAWTKYSKENTATEEDKNKHLSSQLTTYSNLAGAVGSMYEEGSSGAKAMMQVQQALAIIEGGLAVVHQMSSGDPYSAIPRAIAVAAMVSQFVDGFGGSASANTYEVLSSQNTTTVFGGGDDPSESLKNSMEIVSDLAEPQFQTLSSMNQYLASIDANIRGSAADIIRTGEYALGVGAINSQTSYEGSTDMLGMATTAGVGAGLAFLGSSAAGAAMLGTTLGALSGGAGLAVLALDKILLDGAISGLFSKGLSALGLGGGGYDWQMLAGSGLAIGDTSAQAGQTYTSRESYYGSVNSQQAVENKKLGDLIDNFSGLLFQSQAYESMSKNFWGSASYSYSSATTYQEMTSELENSLSRTFENIRDAIVISSDTLGKDVEDNLNNLVVSIGSIDLSGLSGDELIEKLNNEFSAQADIFTQAIYGTSTDSLAGFQDIGEGLFETLVRVSSGMEIAGYYIGRLGSLYEDVDFEEIVNKKGEVGLEALKQSILDFEDTAYSVSNGVADIVSYMQGSADDLYTTYDGLVDIRSQIEYLGISYTALSSSMLLGADGVDNLSSSLESYYENFLNEQQQLTYKIQDITTEFNKLGLSLPSSTSAFEDLVAGIDTSSESGQELLGSVLSLSEGFADLTTDMMSMLDAERSNALEMAELNRTLQEEELKFYDEAISAVESLSNTFETLIDSVDGTISTLLRNSDSSNTQDQLIASFWDKRSQADLLLAKDGDLTSSESAELSSLIGNISSLATDIQAASVGDNSAITESLVSELSFLQKELSLDDKILQTQIVDASGTAVDVAKESGVLSSLTNAINQYNTNMDEALGKTLNPLTFDDFKAGGLLSTADEINFRQSFKEDSYKTYDTELKELRSNLAMLSLSTVDAADYLKVVAETDITNTSIGNIQEFFATLGEMPEDVAQGMIELAWMDALAGAKLGDAASVQYIKDIDIEGVYADKYADYFDYLDYLTEDEAREYNVVLTDELINKMGIKIDSGQSTVDDLLKNLAKAGTDTVTEVQDFFNKYSTEDARHELLKDVEKAINIKQYGDYDLTDGDLVKLWSFSAYGSNDIGLDAFAMIDEEVKALGLSQIALRGLEDAFSRGLDVPTNVLNAIDNYLDGSHADGLSYVPFDGYRAELHRGERVLTAEENLAYQTPTNIAVFTPQNNNKEVADLLRTLIKKIDSIDKSDAKTAKVLENVIYGIETFKMETKA